jgi:hypothetical protein
MLVQLAARVNRIQSEAAQIQTDLTVLLEAEGRMAPPRPMTVRRKKWTGPVSAEVHAERKALYGYCFGLGIALGLDPTDTDFARRHHIPPSEVSRWKSSRGRGIAPGSSTDINVRRGLHEDRLRYESMVSAKTLGKNEITKPALLFSA